MTRPRAAAVPRRARQLAAAAALVLAACVAGASDTVAAAAAPCQRDNGSAGMPRSPWQLYSVPVPEDVCRVAGEHDGGARARDDETAGADSAASLPSSEGAAERKGAVAVARARPVPSDALATRVNYASLDCSAKVLASNSEAQSTSSLLSDNRDRYMLNPCSAKKWVEIELCDEILIDTVELANFEMFSSMPNHVVFYIAQKYPPADVDAARRRRHAQRARLQAFAVDRPLFFTKNVRGV